MLSIGEFSKICKVSTKTLRYYDEIGLIKPSKINQENSGNVIYVNPSNNIVIAITSYFKPTIFDRIDFVQKYIEPFI